MPDQKLTQEQVKAFLKGLTDLTRRYKVEITGCGCCGSPYIKPLEDDRLTSRYCVEWGYKYSEGENLSFTESVSYGSISYDAEADNA